jgi:hypothetical protein
VFIYVRGAASAPVYHWCPNCPDYPASVTHPLVQRPTEHLCSTCEQLERDGGCGNA